ncbi:MAG TPA: hypothetical protein VMS76_15890 [Planctomycetota bacterium]|nr:hypothetical protein [Planctomycetota bacterium]
MRALASVLVSLLAVACTTPPRNSQPPPRMVGGYASAATIAAKERQLRESPKNRIPTAEEIAAAPIGEPPDEEAARFLAEVVMKSNLKDPMSAVIQWSPMRRSWYRDESGKVSFAWELLGLLNAKNSYGGYTGFKPHRFYYRDRTPVAMSWLYEGSELLAELDDKTPIEPLKKLNAEEGAKDAAGKAGER